LTEPTGDAYTGAFAEGGWMTEAQWLVTTDPQKMLAHLYRRVGNRKLRLFACACSRQVWGLLTNALSRRAVEVAERYADGEGGVVNLRAASEEAWGLSGSFDPEVAEWRAANAAANTSENISWYGAEAALKAVGEAKPEARRA
jgi:hypothetical protein